MNGPEIAFRYPGSARAFVDLDLLVPDARTVHAQLRDSGFMEFGDPAFHHRRPLSRPDLPLLVEIHSAPKWPDRLAAPDTREVIDNAIPSVVGVDGVLAPGPARHAVLIAAHAWAHQPLGRLRDLVDIRAIAAEADAAEMDRLVRAWQLARIWRTTGAVADALFGEGRRPLALRLRGRVGPRPGGAGTVRDRARRLLEGLRVIGLHDGASWRLVEKTAFDSMPAQRRRAIAYLAETGIATTKAAALALGLPTTVRRTLEDLAANRIVERRSEGEGRADTWQLSAWTLERYGR